jgi:MFS family permease
VGRSELRVLGFVTFALFFEHYDTSLLANALKYIREDLQIAEQDLGLFQMLIRAGALPAFLVVPFVDRVGRRRLFLLSLIGLSIQMIVRTFVLTASAIAVVIVAEELPAAARGWGIGMLAAVSAAGHGLGAVLFAAIEILPYGWRALYALGVLPLLLLPLFSRRIKETARFQAHRAGGLSAGVAWWSPLRAFAVTDPGRAITMAALASGAALGHVVVLSFTGYFVLQYHGWAAYELSLMVLAAGAVGVAGNVVAGRLADRIGRRRVGFAFLLIFPAGAWCFYNGPGWSLAVLWALLIFSMMGGNVIIRALSSELFPTSHRGTSTGLLVLMETLGAALAAAGGRSSDLHSNHLHHHGLLRPAVVSVAGNAATGTGEPERLSG